MFLDEVAERVFAGENGKEVVSGDELQILEQPEIGRVGDRDGERPALAFEREDDVLHRQLGGNEAEDLRIDFETRQIDRGHPMVPRQHSGEVDLVHEAQLGDDISEALLTRLLIGKTSPYLDQRPELRQRRRADAGYPNKGIY